MNATSADWLHCGCIGGRPTVSAQAPTESGAMMLTAVEMQQMSAAYPGLNAGVKSVDAGAHVIDFWLESRKGGAAESASGIVHRRLPRSITFFGQGDDHHGRHDCRTEADRRQRAGLERLQRRFQHADARRSFKGGTPRVVGPGDIIVVPPGTVHQWGTVGTPMLVYFIARIDPSKKLTAGYLNPALTGAYGLPKCRRSFALNKPLP